MNIDQSQITFYNPVTPTISIADFLLLLGCVSRPFWCRLNLTGPVFLFLLRTIFTIFFFFSYNVPPLPPLRLTDAIPRAYEGRSSLTIGSSQLSRFFFPWVSLFSVRLQSFFSLVHVLSSPFYPFRCTPVSVS